MGGKKGALRESSHITHTAHGLDGARPLQMDPAGRDGPGWSHWSHAVPRAAGISHKY